MQATTITAANVFVTGPGATLVATTLSYNAAPRVATLTPSAALTNGVLYTVTVKSGVADLTGNTLAADFTSTFTVDTTPPTVTAVTPSNGTTGTGSLVTVTFGEAMQATTITAANVFLTGPGATPVGAVTCNAATRSG
jgi:hypothetical protein